MTEWTSATTTRTADRDPACFVDSPEDALSHEQEHLAERVRRADERFNDPPKHKWRR